MNYDDHMEPEQLLRRLAYGRAAPLLPYRAQADARFYGRLIDALSNQHAVLVKQGAERTCRNLAARLKEELPADLYAVGVLEAPERDAWLLMVYNRVIPELRYPPQRDATGTAWVGMPEISRMLQLSYRQTHTVVKRSGIEIRREGGRGIIKVRQRDLVILANRPGRRRKRPKVTIT